MTFSDLLNLIYSIEPGNLIAYLRACQWLIKRLKRISKGSRQTPVLPPFAYTVIIYSMHRDDLIIATLREQRCTACNQGVFRFESAVPATFNERGKWLHRCSNRHCDETLFRFLCISLSRNMLYTYS